MSSVQIAKMTVATGEQGHKGAQVRCAGKHVRHFQCTHISCKVIKQGINTLKTFDKDSRSPTELAG